MVDIDDKITSALDADDKAFLDSLDDGRGLFTQIGDMFDGPLSGWTKVVFVAPMIIGLALLYCVVQLFTAEATREIILWAVGVIALLILQGFTKDWLFSRMNMLSILREVKRLQVQVALLSEEKRGD